MNKNLEIKKTKSELAAVVSARMALEYRVEESLDNIERLKEHIKIQIIKEDELNSKIIEMEK